MTRRQQIEAAIEAFKAQARMLLEKDGVTQEELTEINNKIILEEKKLEIEERISVDVNARTGKQQKAKVPEDATEDAQYETAVFNALRGKATAQEMEILDTRNKLSSLTEEDGGYLIPVDQQTAINELKRSFLSLKDLVNVESVNTRTGSRVFEKDMAHTPFGVITEDEDLEESDNPKWVTVNYTIQDRGGILPVPNGLLNDNNSNVKAYLNKWLAKKAVATENAIIGEVLDTFAKTPVTGLDDIKDALDVTLDPTISAMASIVVNQDAFNYLNKLKDEEGNYILERDPKVATRKLLSGRPVIVYSNKVLKTKDGKAPIIMGSLEEAITMFDRQAISLLSTNIGGTAFKKNRTEIRAILRADAQKTDANAVVYGEITLNA